MGSLSRRTDNDAQFTQLADKIKTMLFTISSNIAAVQRMIAHYGTERDTLEMREKLYADVVVIEHACAYRGN